MGFVAGHVRAHAETTTCSMVQSAMTYDVHADHVACDAPFAVADITDPSFGAGVVRCEADSSLELMFVAGCGMNSKNAFLTRFPGS